MSKTFNLFFFIFFLFKCTIKEKQSAATGIVSIYDYKHDNNAIHMSWHSDSSLKFHSDIDNVSLIVFDHCWEVDIPFVTCFSCRQALCSSHETCWSCECHPGIFHYCDTCYFDVLRTRLHRQLRRTLERSNIIRKMLNKL